MSTFAIPGAFLTDGTRAAVERSPGVLRALASLTQFGFNLVSVPNPYSAEYRIDYRSATRTIAQLTNCALTDDGWLCIGPMFRMDYRRKVAITRSTIRQSYTDEAYVSSLQVYATDLFQHKRDGFDARGRMRIRYWAKSTQENDGKVLQRESIYRFYQTRSESLDEVDKMAFHILNEYLTCVVESEAHRAPGSGGCINLSDSASFGGGLAPGVPSLTVIPVVLREDGRYAATTSFWHVDDNSRGALTLGHRNLGRCILFRTLALRVTFDSSYVVSWTRGKIWADLLSRLHISQRSIVAYRAADAGKRGVYTSSFDPSDPSYPFPMSEEMLPRGVDGDVVPDELPDTVEAELDAEEAESDGVVSVLTAGSQPSTFFGSTVSNLIASATSTFLTDLVVYLTTNRGEAEQHHIVEATLVTLVPGFVHTFEEYWEVTTGTLPDNASAFYDRITGASAPLHPSGNLLRTAPINSMFLPELGGLAAELPRKRDGDQYLNIAHQKDFVPIRAPVVNLSDFLKNAKSKKKDTESEEAAITRACETHLAKGAPTVDSIFVEYGIFTTQRPAPEYANPKFYLGLTGSRRSVRVATHRYETEIYRR